MTEGKGWRRQIVKKVSEFILIFACADVIATALLFVFFLYLTPTLTKKGQTRRIFIEEGTPFERVVQELKREEIISSPGLFSLLAQITMNTKKIKAGEYVFPAPQRPFSVLTKLVKGEVATYYITIPEGSTMYDIGQILERYRIANKERFLQLAGSGEVAKSYDIDLPSLEGFLFPDTYLMTRGMNERSIITMMVKRFRKAFTEKMEKRRLEMGIPLNRLITIASIIEKETSLRAEMPIIASIIYRRLKKHMRLQMDPTVIYGLKKWDGRLTRKDLTTYSKFNTYLIQGLPPSPISNPGTNSIKAALYPSKTRFLYFVSKNDGSHYFSRTLRQHINAVNRYQKKKRRKKR